MGTGLDGNKRMGRTMLFLAWLALLGLLTLWFDDALLERINPNQTPVSYRANGGVEVRLKQNTLGHYVSGGQINGEDVVFLLDTGATHVSVPAHLAKRLGLMAGQPQRVNTANGQITVYATRIDTLAIGKLLLYDVRASLNPAMGGDEILLGMSALKDLEFSQKNGWLHLRQPADVN